MRDLRLCLQSADKELAEVKGDLKKKEKQVTDIFLQVRTAIQYTYTCIYNIHTLYI